MFVLHIPGSGKLSETVTLEKEKWITLKFVWDGTLNPRIDTCAVYVNGQITPLKLELGNKSVNGISYARFRSGSRKTDRDGIYIEYVKAGMGNY